MVKIRQCEKVFFRSFVLRWLITFPTSDATENEALICVQLISNELCEDGGGVLRPQTKFRDLSVKYSISELWRTAVSAESVDVGSDASR